MDQEIEAGEPAQEEEEQHSQADEQRSQAFEAMFEGRATETPPPATEDKPEEQQAPAKAEPKYVQLTEDELVAMRKRLEALDSLQAAHESLNKGLNTLSGRVGGIQQGINNRQVIKLPKEKLDRYRTDMPEVAELFDALEVSTTGPAVDDERITQVAKERLAPEIQKARDEALTTARRELREELLGDEHPDWREYTGTQEFAEFVRAQGAEYQAKLAAASENWDRKFISKAITDSKSAKAKAASTANARRDRMASNVTPRGTAAPTTTVKSREEAFNEVFDATYQRPR